MAVELIIMSATIRKREIPRAGRRPGIRFDFLFNMVIPLLGNLIG
jgi:hypothetical protein